MAFDFNYNNYCIPSVVVFSLCGSSFLLLCRGDFQL